MNQSRQILIQRRVEDWPKSLTRMVLSMSRSAEEISTRAGLLFTNDLDDLGELQVSLLEMNGALFGLMYRPQYPSAGTSILVEALGKVGTDDARDVVAALGYGPDAVYWPKDHSKE